jgi:hypothetical protein
VAESAEDRFLREFDHGEEAHLAVGLTSWDSAAINRWLSGGAIPRNWTPDHCGWWWCTDSAAVSSWGDLSAALGVLRAHGLDPNGPDGAEIAHGFTTVRSWGEERDGFEELNTALVGCSVEHHAESLRQKFLEELAPFLKNSREFRPDKPGPKGPGAPPRNHALNHALKLAENKGWRADDVAAILLLVGVERSSWTALRDKVRQAYGRTKIAAVP